MAKKPKKANSGMRPKTSAEKKLEELRNSRIKLKTPPRPTRLVAMLLSLMTMILAVLSIMHNDNWFYRIGTQGALGLLMLLNGMEAIIITKKRTMGITLLAVSGFILASMIFTFYVGKTTHAF